MDIDTDVNVLFFLQVPPIDYLRQVTVDLGGATGTPAESLPGNSSNRSSVATLIKRFNEVWKSRFDYSIIDFCITRVC